MGNPSDFNNLYANDCKMHLLMIGNEMDVNPINLIILVAFL